MSPTVLDEVLTQVVYNVTVLERFDPYSPLWVWLVHAFDKAG